MKLNLFSLLIVLSVFSQLNCYSFPDEVSGALDTMWSSIKNTVRRPVTLKRKGRRARRTRVPSTAIPLPLTTTTIVPTREPQSTATPSRVKIELPVLPNPEWRDLLHWSNLQRPWFALEIFKEIQTQRYVNNEASEIIPHINKPANNKHLLNSELVHKFQSSLYH